MVSLDCNASFYLFSTRKSMAKKCHNNTLQTNPRHHEEETQNTSNHIYKGYKEPSVNVF